MKSYFVENAQVVIAACHVGNEGLGGFEVVSKLAKAWGVPVLASQAWVSEIAAFYSPLSPENEPASAEYKEKLIYKRTVYTEVRKGVGKWTVAIPVFDETNSKVIGTELYTIPPIMIKEDFTIQLLPGNITKRR